MEKYIFIKRLILLNKNFQKNQMKKYQTLKLLY